MLLINLAEVIVLKNWQFVGYSYHDSNKIGLCYAPNSRVELRQFGGSCPVHGTLET